MNLNAELFMPTEVTVSLSAYLRVEISRDLIVDSEYAGGTTLLSPSSGKYYLLGETASRIWELLVHSLSVGCVVDALLEEYNVDRMTCEADVFSFLATLSEERLIRFSM
ncbi:PqqD family peptide modification chaperone [Paenibacillus sp. GCM10027627]|uniref:PqqD family peptide modification chaperone n=1 Tax=unclassified Paenibacillus TaxID=185978 RepID=UPI003633BFB8